MLCAGVGNKTHSSVVATPGTGTVRAKECESNTDCKDGFVCVVRMGTGSKCEKSTDDYSATTAATADTHANLCPHAAKRLLDKAYKCGFNTNGLTEATMCSAMDYDRVIYLESLNCREMENLLTAVSNAR
jgi:hypothetical protein